MKLVIDIDEDIYLDMKKGDFDYARQVVKSLQATIASAIISGTPLPKGHGDLIDRSTLEPDTEWSDWDDGWISYSYGQIVDADVVIKADGGSEDEDSN